MNYSSTRRYYTAIYRLKPTFKLVNDFSAVLAVSFGAGTVVTALVWGSIRMILTDLEASLLAVYTEVICFYARTIHFFRSQKHAILLRNSWSELSGDFGRTVQRIKRLSATIESEVELTRMRHDNQKYHEILDLMTHFHTQRPDAATKGRHHIPFSESPRFWGREHILSQIDGALAGNASTPSLRLFVLCGMAGVGKTQIALKYANASRDKFDSIFWISSDNTITIGQSFREIAKSPGLIEPGIENSRWLLVFDNADDLSVLKQVWPSSATGAILLTSRDPTAMFCLASDGIKVEPFDTMAGSAVPLNILGLDPDTQSNKEKAAAITSALGGLPLALNQIGGFIAQRKIPLHDFLPLYNRNSESVDSRSTVNMNYNHTLATVWEMSLSRLSGDAKTLLTLLDAEEALLQGTLIDKSNESGIVSMHRLVQRAVIRHILKANFPDTYSAEVGHKVASWTRCEASLPHLENLTKQNEKFNIFPKDNQALAELLLRCSWYLYERENYSIARKYVEIALQSFSDTGSLAYASAVDLQGLIDLDICHPKTALAAFGKAYELHSAILSGEDAFLAANLVNFGLALTELGDLDEARDFLQKSIDIRLKHNSDGIGNSYSNMSSLLLRMEKADEAEEMLKRCPSLKNFTDATFLKTGNPQFSGQLLDECIKILEGLPPIEGLRHLARAHYKLSCVLSALGKDRDSTEHLDQAAIESKFQGRNSEVRRRRGSR
ncbi:TPR-like protein [Aspergillus ellipticus CBS 707.79]|uniref:TPR-like protein n=1 Tax=Aspergillus ellipticus CBS 707.79 TaxID=1448320 RepID=A0A319D993_9EURO|nr:TPR-like protein [Aspergillus ellipticus CBS 707.79]